jgi:hypothetical protein
MTAPARAARSIRFIAVGVLLSLPGAAASAQRSLAHETSERATAIDAEMSAFLAAARAGSERYRDRETAIAAGYKRLGMDFPSMGEHWVHSGKVLSGKFDPADPPMLTYAMIRGRVELLGVVYAVPLSPDGEPPRLPGGIDRWHEHNGTVDEESMLPEHHSHGGARENGTRLAILHLWCWLPNPDGAFAADNWVLPYVRLGIKPPGQTSVPAARALSLLSGGDQFYSSLLRDASPDGQLTASQDAALRGAVAAVNVIASGLRGDAEPSQSDVGGLERVWEDFAARAGLLSLTRQK